MRNKQRGGREGEEERVGEGADGTALDHVFFGLCVGAEKRL